jgi:hypothetical protein
MSKGQDKDQRIMEEKKVFIIQQEVMKQKKRTRKITKNGQKAQCQIGQEFYAF